MKTQDIFEQKRSSCKYAEFNIMTQPLIVNQRTLYWPEIKQIDNYSVLRRYLSTNYDDTYLYHTLDGACRPVLSSFFHEDDGFKLSDTREFKRFKQFSKISKEFLVGITTDYDPDGPGYDDNSPPYFIKLIAIIKK